jgi:hypothetical protein
MENWNRYIMTTRHIGIVAHALTCQFQLRINLVNENHLASVLLASVVKILTTPSPYFWQRRALPEDRHVEKRLIVLTGSTQINIPAQHESTQVKTGQRSVAACRLIACHRQPEASALATSWAD